ncbi:uncharacterized protein JCM10292_004859 [Rhodotorula paludigena]|uniref:uncharacterized protein n=1 Tax=Rhodotorula paludigena TaxID=86838 RepID=UPI00316EE574
MAAGGQHLAPLDGSASSTSAPYSLPGVHASIGAYDASFFAASSSSTPPVLHSPQPPFNGSPFPPVHPSAHSLDSAPPPFSPYPPTPYSATTSMSAPAPSYGPEAPGIGQIRCYWTILTPTLEYVYLDPILELHMGEWANGLRGTSILEWVHPDEREQLAQDLLPKDDAVAGVEGAGVFGSVTRCRYSRLTRIMRHLGCPQPPSPRDASMYAIDADWLNLDITTSWIAGDRKGKGKEGQQGAVLAFFHVTADKDPVQDNDAEHVTAWSNWCGASPEFPGYMTPKQCEDLVDVLTRVSPPSDASHDGKGALHSVLNGGPAAAAATLDDGPPAHVFQILDRAGRAIATFPRSGGGGGKEYDVEQFSSLAREVMARPKEAVQSRTSCTRRYRSKHPVMRNGTLTTIESVVIRYGAVTFACFQTGGVYLSSARKAGLSLVTSDLASPAPQFALEDVPITPTVGANGSSKRSSLGGGADDNSSPPSKRFKPTPMAPPVLPRLQTSAPSVSSASSNSPQQADPSHGLSISTNGRSLRQSLEVEAITAGGISPTVASASAILGSLGDLQAPAAPVAQQESPAPGSYAAFYNQQQQHPVSSPYDQPGLTRQSYFFGAGHASSGPPPNASAYQPHPLSQASSAYFTPAPTSPHDPAPRSPFHHPIGLYPPTSQPFDHHRSQQQQHPTELYGVLPAAGSQGVFDQLPAPPGGQDGAEDDLSAVPPPPAPAKGGKHGSPAGGAKKPPKQRPDGPVFKPNQKACESCGTVNSPEWRKGPTGAKTLCNACGLRYARSVARQKKLAEIAAGGGLAPKKGKKKGAAAAAKEAAAAAAAAASAGNAAEGGSSTPTTSLPPSSSDSPITSSAYNLAPFSSAPHSTPKPYTPYYTSAPNMPAAYSHAGSPTMTHTPQYPSPGISSAPGYFPPIGYGATSSPYPPMGGHGAPMPTHAPLPPLSHVSGGYDFARGLAPQYGGHQQHAPQHSPHLEHPLHSPSTSGGPASVGMFPSQSGGNGQEHQQHHSHAHHSQQPQPQQHHQHQWHSPSLHSPYQPSPPAFGWGPGHSAEQRGPGEHQPPQRGDAE